MKLETDRLILRSIQRGDEKIFAKMAIDGSLLQVGFDENSHEWINDWILEAEELTRNDNPRINYIPCTIELMSTGEVRIISILCIESLRYLWRISRKCRSNLLN